MDFEALLRQAELQASRGGGGSSTPNASTDGGGGHGASCGRQAAPAAAAAAAAAGTRLCEKLKAWAADQRLVQAKASGQKSAAGVLHVLLIVIDNVPHESLWRHWATSATPAGHSARFYIHAKHPERVHSVWARERLTARSFCPE